MAKIMFGMNVSLDGYVGGADGELSDAFIPSDELFHHFVEEAATLTGSLYGRRMYEVMRYWDDDDPQWDDERRAYAAAWRRQRKWVVSRTLKSVGPNAELIEGDPIAAVRDLKARIDGTIEVAGPELAGQLAALGLVDEYQIYLRPLVLGGGKPFFTGPTPPLRLTAHEEIAADAIRLTYVPA